MKRFVTTLTALTAAFALALPVGVLAEEPKTGAIVISAEAPGDAPAAKAEFTTTQATVKSVDAAAKQIVATTDKGDVVYKLADTLIYDQISASPFKIADIEVGLPIDAVYPVNAPMTLSEPPQIAPLAVIVYNAATGKPNVAVDRFDKEGLSSDGSVRLPKTIPADVLFDADDKAFETPEGALTSQLLIVFYAVSTKSLPPIIEPDKVVVIEYDAVSEEPPSAPAPTEAPKPAKPAGDDAYVAGFVAVHFRGSEIVVKNNVTYVQLQPLAELMGYDVPWDAEWKADIVTISRGNSVYSIQSGSKTYGYDGEGAAFKNAPISQNGKLYVEADFISVFK